MLGNWQHGTQSILKKQTESQAWWPHNPLAWEVEGGRMTTVPLIQGQPGLEWHAVRKKKKKHGIQPQRKTNSIGNCSPSVAPSRPKAPSPAPVSVYTKTGFALVDHQSRNVHCRAHNFSLCFGWRINGPRRLGDVPKATLMALPLVLSYVLGHMETLSTRPFWSTCLQVWAPGQVGGRESYSSVSIGTCRYLMSIMIPYSSQSSIFSRQPPRIWITAPRNRT